MGQRLLLVDSDRRFVKDHQVALESAFDVEFVYSGEGVIPRLESGEFAAVLISVEVSENKGYALCSTIRKNAQLSNLKVALISSKATEEEYARHRSLKGKADLYLHKPMISGSLVSALSALVPARAIDPDNPLGDLSGADLGDEWLDSLKSELDTDEKPAAPVAELSLEPSIETPVAPPPVSVPMPKMPSMATVAIPIPVALQAPVAAPASPDAGKIALLEARVKDLEYKLQTTTELVGQKDQELDQLRQEHDVATRNLDELDLQRNTVEQLQQQLREAQELLQAAESISISTEQEQSGLKARLEELEGEQQRQRDAADALAHQLAEKDQALVSVEQAKDELQQRLESLQATEGQLGEAQAELDRLRSSEQERDALARRSQELEEELGGLRSELDRVRGELGLQNEGQGQRIQELEGQLESLNQRREELEQQSGAQNQRREELEQQVESQKQRAEESEGRFQALEADLKATAEQCQGAEATRDEALRRADALQAELESAAGSQERLAQVQEELARRSGECQEFQALLEGRNAELAEKNRELETARVDVAGLEATLRAQRRELVEQEDRLRAQVRETDGLRETLAATETRVSEQQTRNSELEARTKELEFRGSEQEAWIAELESRNQAQENVLAERLQEMEQLKAAVEEMRARLSATEALHAKELEDFQGRINAMEQERQQVMDQFEIQKLELLRGLDEKEALVNRLNASLDAQRERIESLDQEKRGIEGHLNERTARLEALTGAISDLENNIRRASDLTRPF